MRTLLSSLPLLAWVMSLSFTLWIRAILDLVDATLLVPLVSLPRSSQGDVVSDVTGFVLVIAWALICLLLVEPTKWAAARSAKGSWRLLYLMLVAYQVVLLGDSIRSQTFDWWKWLLSLVGAATLTPANEFYMVAGFRFPWLSLGMALASGFLVFQSLPKHSEPTSTFGGSAAGAGRPTTLSRERHTMR